MLLLLLPCVLQYDVTKERIIALIDADKAMLETLAEGVRWLHKRGGGAAGQVGRFGALISGGSSSRSRNV
jgi:hypothetical protein